MKVLFLDIDGVVNCQTTKERIGSTIGIEPVKMALIKRIVKQTGCVVVLSSSWRLYPPDLAHVREHIDLYDVTPDKRGLTDRGCEVKEWMDNHPDVTAYAILDDSSDFHEDQPLFRTSWKTGITDEIAEQVIARLTDKHNKELI